MKDETVVLLESSGDVEEIPTKRQDIKVGDVVCLRGHCSVPADVLVLHTSHYKDGNQCYIETSNIDGETNLKLKEAPPEVRQYITGDQPNMQMFQGHVEYEPPNKSIYTFNGTLHLEDSSTPIPLGPSNILLRGSVFSNTEWAYGVVIYTGQDTKIQMNNRRAPSKLSKIEIYANTSIKVIFIAQVLLSIVTVGSIYLLGFDNYSAKLPYVYPPNTSRTSILPLWLEYFFVFFILYNQLIPISLYVTLELVNIGQAVLMFADLEMYDADLDTPCVVRASNLCQELGLVSNIFSDKTGTLTRNEMKLVKFIVDGMSYDAVNGSRHAVGEAVKEEKGVNVVSLAKESVGGICGDGISDKKIGELYEFLRCLMVCHTIIIEKGGSYRAESPDELALIDGLLRYKCRILERSTTKIIIELLGEKQEYLVLAVNAFTSERKRMSILVKGAITGQHLLLCKGADSTVLPLCNVSVAQMKDAEKALFDLSCLGLRTLCVAMKPLSDDAANDFLNNFRSAQSSITDREQLLTSAAAKVEQDLRFLGISAVEDRLQDEVPEVIADLAKAGIVLWMLTGDKQETAISIGTSCNLITRNTKTLFLSGISNEDDFEFRLNTMAEDVRSHFVEGQGYKSKEQDLELGLVIDGPSFNFFNEDDNSMRRNLMTVCQSCRSVIACRLTPRQKQALVHFVKREMKRSATCLAIGDGANDVSMILEADVGVGIFGKEGRQAANNADFAIGQFKFLKRLLLLHGRWNYVRQARSFLYCAHKTQVIVLTLYWYNYLCAISGTSPYASWVFFSFNIVLGLPIILLGILDKDISEDTALRYPHMYSTSKNNVYLNFFAILGWILNACVYGVILSLLYFYAMTQSVQSEALYVFGTAMYVGVFLSLQAKLVFMHHQMTWIQGIVIFLSIVALLGFLEILSVSSNFDTGGYYGIATHVYEYPTFWLFSFFTVPLILVLVDLTFYFILVFFSPTNEMKFREIDKQVICRSFSISGLRLRAVGVLPALESVRLHSTQRAAAHLIRIYDTAEALTLAETFTPLDYSTRSIVLLNVLAFELITRISL